MLFTNNMDRRSGPTKRWSWSSIHIVWYPTSVFAKNWLYCVGLLELYGYINFVNFTNCPRTFGGHCRYNLKALLKQEMSHPEFYGDVINKLRHIIGHRSTNFQTVFAKRIWQSIKRVILNLYCNVLMVWLSVILQLATTLYDDRKDLVINGTVLDLSTIEK